MTAFTLLLLAFSTAIVADGGQGASCASLASVAVPERSYAQLNVPAFDQRVFVYTPAIESSWGREFKPFQLWIVEGVYGKPFVKSSGAMDEREFERIRASRNVKATAVSIGASERGKRVPLTIAKQRVALDLTVDTSLGGTDRVIINVCRWPARPPGSPGGLGRARRRCRDGGGVCCVFPIEPQDNRPAR